MAQPPLPPDHAKTTKISSPNLNLHQKMQLLPSTNHLQSLESQIKPKATTSSNHTRRRPKIRNRSCQGRSRHLTTMPPECHAQTRATTHHSCSISMDAHRRGHHQRPQNRDGNRTSTSPFPRRRRRLPSNDSYPIRSPESHEETSEKTHLPRHRAALPSLFTPGTWEAHQDTQRTRTGARRRREKKNPQNPRTIPLRQHLAIPSKVVSCSLSAASARDREGGGAPQFTEFARQAGRVRVCQGGSGPHDSPGRSSGLSGGPG